MILNLKDGGIVDIYDDCTYYNGCETCDYGSEYITECKITMTKHIIDFKTNQMYRYAISQGDMMKIILSNIEKILTMSEMDFSNWLQDELKNICSNVEYNLSEVK